MTTSVSLLKMRVLRAAKAWWKGHRPSIFSLEDHLNAPTINTCTETEKQLARAIAALDRESWQTDDAGPLVQELYALVRILEQGRTAYEKATVMRKAEAFLGLREVTDDTTPKEAPKAGKLARRR